MVFAPLSFSRLVLTARSGHFTEPSGTRRVPRHLLGPLQPISGAAPVARVRYTALGPAYTPSAATFGGSAPLLATYFVGLCAVTHWALNLPVRRGSGCAVCSVLHPRAIDLQAPPAAGTHSDLI